MRREGKRKRERKEAREQEGNFLVNGGMDRVEIMEKVGGR